ncbi:MAG: hypothetical protein HRF49_05570 [bacterium]|jgi:hypothetical protein
MAKYYPKGYRKKRRQERMQQVVGYTVIGVFVAAAAVISAWWFIKQFTPGTPERGTDNLALKSEQLEAKNVEREANQNPPVEAPPPMPFNDPALEAPVAATEAEPVPAEKPIDLKDIKDFAESFPIIGISLLKQGSPGTTAAPPEEAPLETGPRPGETAVPDDDEKDDERPTPPGGAESVRPGPPVSRDNPPADSGSGVSRPDKPAEKPAEKPADKPAEKPSEKPGGSGSGGVKGDYVYAVYAAIIDEKDAATKKLDELSGIGYAARIIEADSGGKKAYYILVEDKLSSYEKAKEIQGDLKSKGFGEAFVRKDKA